MSLKAINKFKMCKMSPTQKLVMLCLCDCHNQESERCDPSVSLIMSFTGLSNRAVATALKDLERLKHIKINRGNGFKSSYNIDITSEPPAVVDLAKPVNVVPQPVNLPHPRSTFTSEPPAITSEPPAGVPVNLLPKPVNVVHTNREEQRIKQRITGSTDRLDSPLFEETDSHDFRSTMAEWFEDKSQRKQRYTHRGWRALLTTCRQKPIGVLRCAVNKAMSGGWQGIHFDKISAEDAAAFEPTSTIAFADPIKDNANFMEFQEWFEKLPPEPESTIDVDFNKVLESYRENNSPDASISHTGGPQSVEEVSVW
jgi:hypothetical protein